ncbi:glycosyltransferase [uncultured Desulfuromonas sp.]|uniref:glycosyltransferase n=1 Tax=uncultured Desulfuromonas sp. TaxID=181013 RepID=UPI002AAA7883|nr:glycosyltransferase [uncultured Desulfuromonas sp.]
MKLMQILLSQSEAGAETYFEKVAVAFAQDAAVEQRLVIEAQPSREQRLQRSGVDFRTLPMGRMTKPLFYHHRLKREVQRFNPDLIVTWVNRASRKCPPTSAVVVGRLGGYYDIANYRKCDHLIVNTPDLMRHVTGHGWPQQRVSMISNFGELPESLEVPESLPSIPADHRVLLTLGRLHEKKAQDVLIRALPDIPQSILLIAGDGDLRPSLAELATSLGVADRVHFLGLRKDVRALFELADICVFPSRFEPLGNVVLEAWSTGIPIVAAASQGPSWLIDDGSNGLLFEVDSAVHCAAQVNRLLVDQSLADRLVEQGRRTFSQEFSMEVIITRYKALFMNLVAQQACGGAV